MGDRHEHTFYNKEIGLIIRTSSKRDPFIEFEFTKRFADKMGSPSDCILVIFRPNLEEIIWIIEVLKQNLYSWHKTHKNGTNFSIKWGSLKQTTLWINVNNCSKMFKSTQIIFLKSIMEHILNEKIVNATNNPEEQTEAIERREVVSKHYKTSTTIKKFGNTKVKMKKKIKNDIKQITGTIKFETKRALLLDIFGDDVWIPKSTIKSLFNEWSKKQQLFYIESWVLAKNLK